MAERVHNFTLLTRRDDLTVEQFRSHWLHVHAEIARRLPGLVSYTQHHIVDSAARSVFPAPERTVDGIVELVFEDRATMDAAFAGEVGDELVADAENFMSQMRTYIVEDEFIVTEADPE